MGIDGGELFSIRIIEEVSYAIHQVQSAGQLRSRHRAARNRTAQQGKDQLHKLAAYLISTSSVLLSIPGRVLVRLMEKLLRGFSNKFRISKCNQKYQYAELRYEDSIRLVVIQQGIYAAPLQCDLVDTRLSSDPSFEALSYTWQDPAARAALAAR